MPDYRLQPRKTGGYLVFTLALAALVLGGPFALVPILPDNPRADEPVVLTSLDFEESFAGLSCTPNPESEGNSGWFCGDADLDYYSYPDIKDGTLLLRRTLRYISSTSRPILPKMDSYLADQEPIVSGNASFMADPKAHAVAISLRGEGENAQDFYVVTITGTRAAVAETAEEIWKSATQEDLPEAARTKLQRFDKYTVTGETIGKLKENLPA